MSFGFDAIDRKFQPKAPIKLECTECKSTTDVATRTDIDGEPALCPTCHHFRKMESWGGYG